MMKPGVGKPDGCGEVDCGITLKAIVNPLANCEPGTHILSYLKRRVATQPGLAKLETPAVSKGLLRPAGHAFGEEWVWKRYARGEDLTVWLFSSLRLGHDSLPPALDARIRVASGADQPQAANSKYLRYLLELLDKAGNRRHHYVFKADRNGSVYLPWADATELLFDLEFVSKRATTLDKSLRDTPTLLPRHFQRSRILTDGSIRQIADFAAKVLKRPRAFISYRWEDATPKAGKTVADQSRDGYACWWDRWGMSRSVAEQKNFIPERDIAKVIKKACLDCTRAVIVKSPGYGQSGWTAWEQKVLEKMARDGHLDLVVIE